MATSSTLPTISATASSTACARTRPARRRPTTARRRVERIGGDTTVFDKGNLHRLRRLQEQPRQAAAVAGLRAKRIIHKNDEQMIYYEDADLEFLGIPVAYTPFLSAPDPTVLRKSGRARAPKTFYKSAARLWASNLPIFFNFAPNYDLTVTPTAFTNQGFFGSRPSSGSGSTTGCITFVCHGHRSELHPGAFATAPLRAPAIRRLPRRYRHQGRLRRSPTAWRFGWNIAALSDKYYLFDYSIPNEIRSPRTTSASRSRTLYLTGQGDRSFFDLARLSTSRACRATTSKTQQPVAHPGARLQPDGGHRSRQVARRSGGQLEFDFNLTSLSAESASFQAVGPRVLDSDLSGSTTPATSSSRAGPPAARACCAASAATTRAPPARSTTSASTSTSSARFGTPFAFARVNGETLDLNTSTTYTYAANGNFSSSTRTPTQTAFVQSGARPATSSPASGSSIATRSSPIPATGRSWSNRSGRSSRAPTT